MMGDVLGDCGHRDPVDGCLSCEEVPLDKDHERGDDLAEAIDRQNRVASMIGTAPTCTLHRRTPCDVCGGIVSTDVGLDP